MGFTNDKKNLERMVVISGGRKVVRVKMVVDEVASNGIPDGEEKVMRPSYEEVLPTDVLVQITTSFRVYRNVDALKQLKKPA